MRWLRDALASAPTAALAGGLASIVVGAGLSGFAIAELTSDDSPSPAPRQATAAQAEGPGVTGGQNQEHADPAVPGSVPSWPQDLTAHTVVLAAESRRATAIDAAREARTSGLDAGVMPSEPYGFGAGLWIVYSGQFATAGAAARQADKLAARYPGAHAELVQSSQ
jgi:hypothetical protein